MRSITTIGCCIARRSSSFLVSPQLHFSKSSRKNESESESVSHQSINIVNPEASQQPSSFVITCHQEKTRQWSFSTAQASQHHEINMAIAEADTKALWKILDSACQPEFYRIPCYIFYSVGCLDPKILHSKLEMFKNSLLVPNLTKLLKDDKTHIDHECSIWLLSALKHIPSKRKNDVSLINSINLAIERSIARFTGVSISYQVASDIVYGLRLLSSDVREVRLLVANATKLVAGCRPHRKDSDFILESNVGRIVHGLRGLDSKHREVVGLLHEVVRLMQGFKGELRGGTVAMVMFGIRNLSGDSTVVRLLLRTIAELISLSKAVLEPEQCASVLHAFQSIGDGSPEAKLLLSSAVKLIQPSLGAMDVHMVVMMFEGLRSLSRESDTVQVILVYINNVLNASSSIKHMSPHRLSIILRSIAGFSSRSTACRSLLVHITRFVLLCQRPNANECALMFTGLSEKRIDSYEVRELIAALTRLLKNCSDTFNSQGIAMILYGMRTLSVDCQEVLDLIDVLHIKASKCKGEFGAQQCAMMVVGLNQMSSDHESVRKLVVQVTRLLATCREEPSSQACAMMLRGLRRMSADSKETVELVIQVTRLVSMSSEPPTVQGVAMVLNGLSHIYGGFHDEVLHLLFEVHRMLQQCEGEVTSQGAAMMMSGLKGLAHYPEVLGLVAEVSRLLQQCSGPVTCLEATMIVQGLKGLSTDEYEVVELLIEARRLLSTCRGDVKMDGQMAAMMLSGLQDISTDSKEALALIKEVVRLLKTCDEGLLVQEYFQVLRGVQGLWGDYPVARELMAEVKRLFSLSSDSISPSAKVKLMDYLALFPSKYVKIDGIDVEIERLSEDSQNSE